MESLSGLRQFGPIPRRNRKTATSIGAGSLKESEKVNPVHTVKKQSIVMARPQYLEIQSAALLHTEMKKMEKPSSRLTWTNDKCTSFTKKGSKKGTIMPPAHVVERERRSSTTWAPHDRRSITTCMASQHASQHSQSQHLHSVLYFQLLQQADHRS